MRISDWSSDVCSSDLQVDYALRQRFPLWGKRGLARTAATQDAIAVGLDRNTPARDLLSDADEAYARHYPPHQAAAMLDSRLSPLRHVEEMARLRYATRLLTHSSETHTSAPQPLIHTSYT